MNKLPKIKAHLLVQDLRDEVLIYDQTTHKSYCLNDTAKTVFNACDGVKTFADVNLPEDIIYLSLDELKRQKLIEDNFVSPFAGLTRREVIRKVGLTSFVALPVIASLVAPSAARAASASCTPGQGNSDVVNGAGGQGDFCVCGQNAQSSLPLCNSSRGDRSIGCKRGCTCRSDFSQCSAGGNCPGACG